MALWDNTSFFGQFLDLSPEFLIQGQLKRGKARKKLFLK
jgi:hypothetical protein